MAQIDETEILDLLKKQHYDDAFKRVVKVYGAELHGYCCGVLASDEDGADLYQDLLAAAWTGLPRFKAASSVRTWAYGIAHHQAQRRRRRYSRKHAVRLNTDTAERLTNHGSAPLDSKVAQGARMAQLQKLRQKLSLVEREILILRVERGLPFKEVAQILGIQEAAARVRFQRTRERLRRLVNAEQAVRI